MANKTCGECLYYDAPFCDYHAMKVASTRKSCDIFDPKEKPPTNGDRIRQMSNEELATWGMYDLGTCPTFEKRQSCPKCGECSASEVEDCWRDWLNAPAKNNTKSEG